MIIADCGEMCEQKDSFYAELTREGHIHIDLPFDAGFGVMSNAIVDRLERPYLLMGSDDFDFSTLEVNLGILELERALTFMPKVDIAAGRVNNNPYEFNLYVNSDIGYVEERPVTIHERPDVSYIVTYDVDLTVNYFLARKHVFEKVRWDSDVKIGGGEHAAFFLDLRYYGFKTVFVPGVNVNEQTERDSARYKMYRRRAMDSARPCFERRGIRKYVMGNGVVDYNALDNK